LEEFAKGMRKALNIKFWGILIIAIIFSMNQETPAQRKKPKTNKQPVTTQATQPEISYTVSMSKPWTHLFEVEMKMTWDQLPEKAELKMPVWTPGSYLVREYARHIQDFTAFDGGGNVLDWQKTNKNTWEIDTKGAKTIRVGYHVYANELTVRTNELNSEHGFFTPAALLMFPKGGISFPSTITVKPYGNWKVATGLTETPSNQPTTATNNNQIKTFRAANYDILYDSPFEVSNFVEKRFTAQGKLHRYIFSGEGNYDADKIAEDTTKIIDQAIKIFGDLPYDNYTFIVNLRGGGGLEHLNSTALQWQKFGFKPEARYKAFLGLVAHEYFHLWNVKRIRPDALGPFDYENENYTKSLWIAEGGTEYYSNLLLARAGINSDKELLGGLASGIQQLQSRPGRFETSLEDASFDAWIKYYRQDENSVNNQISYYDKGEIVNFLLDVKIRTESNGAKSLNDVMRYLYDEFYKKGKNYTPADYQKISEMMAGKSLEDFFSKYARGTEEIDYNSILNPIGLRLLTGEDGAKKAFLGGFMSESDGKLTVRALPSDTPAYQFGLNTGDEIVAIDGNRASNQFLNYILGEKKPGDKIKLTIFRFDSLRDIEITLEGRTTPNYRILAVTNPSEDQKRLYKEFLGADLK
jgi:predicted metalloprotease with PDZ domain